MISQRQTYSGFLTFLFYASLILIMAHTHWLRIVQNARHTFWLDESIMVFIANHTPFTPSFFRAVQENIAGMPWPFIEYWAYLNLLKLVPLFFLMDHIETFLRLPLVFYTIITTVSVFLMVRRLSGSKALAGIVSICLFGINFLSAHLGGELRFHSSAMMQIAVSWCLLTWYLTSNHDPRKQNFMFGLWVISAILTGWTHLYGIYSVIWQLIVLGLARIQWLPKMNIHLPLNNWRVVTGLSTVFGMLILQAGFFIFWTIHPYHRAGINIEFQTALDQTLSACHTLIFVPNAWFWIGIFTLFLIIRIILAPRWNVRGQYILVGTLGLAQIAVILVLGMYYFSWDWGPFNWSARYMMTGLVPFAFFLSLLAKDILPSKWDNWLAPTLAIIGLCFYFSHPSLQKSYYTHADELVGNSRWVELRHQMRTFNAYGKIKTVIGALPNIRHIDQVDIHQEPLDFSWQIYALTPFEMSSINQYRVKLFGRLEGFSCQALHLFPLATEPTPEYAIDFCEKGKVSLRMRRP